VALATGILASVVDLVSPPITVSSKRKMASGVATLGTLGWIVSHRVIEHKKSIIPSVTITR